MGRALSADLRKRVIGSIEGGLSTRAAAKRFSIGIATAGHWYRRCRRTGSFAARKQRQPPRSKLDPREVVILGLVAEDKDITLIEIAERLEADRGVKGCVGTVWKFFDKRSITYKKDSARLGTTARRCKACAGALVREPTRS